MVFSATLTHDTHESDHAEWCRVSVDPRVSQAAELRGSGGQCAADSLPRLCRWCHLVHPQHFAGGQGDGDWPCRCCFCWAGKRGGGRGRISCVCACMCVCVCVCLYAFVLVSLCPVVYKAEQYRHNRTHLTLSSLKTATAVERIFPFIPENL